MPGIDEIYQALDTIIDPCSAAAGVPCGIATMGLVREIALRPETGGVVVCATKA
jgi:metal-sulfur cluster biosynthetic enzyme